LPGVAPSAGAGHFYLRLRDPCVDQLPAVRPGEIDASGALASEQEGHVRADLIAARSDARADGSEHVARFGAEFRAHFLERLGAPPGPGSPPPGMDYRPHAPVRVRDQDREAVGRAHRDRYAGLVGNERIALSDTPAGSVRHERQTRVNLF